MTKKLALAAAGLLALLALTLVGSAYVASQREFTARESVLFQVLLLVMSVIASVVLAVVTAEDAARAVLGGSARSAFRRLLTLSRSVTQTANAIEARRAFLLEHVDETGAIPSTLVVQALDTLGEGLAASHDGVLDAMDDWRDLVPGEVAKVWAQANDRRPSG